MKERFRSILLIVLVGLNFVLGGKILSDKKLWPSGYNFFITSENKLFQLLFPSGGADSTKTHLGAPTEIMVNTGDQTTRFSVNANAEAFDELFREISKILADSFRTEEKNIAKISKEEWNNVLNSKSVRKNIRQSFWQVFWEWSIYSCRFVLSAGWRLQRLRRTQMFI